MPRRLRVSSGGYAYHVLNRAAGRMRDFGKDRDFEAFEEVLAEAKSRLPMRVLAWCVMANHWHFVLWPRGDGDLSEFMRGSRSRTRNVGTPRIAPRARARCTKAASSRSQSKKTIIYGRCCGMWSETRCGQIWSMRPIRGGGRASGIASAATGRDSWTTDRRRCRTLAAARAIAADRSGVGGVAAFRSAWLSVWRGVVAAADGEAIGSAIDAPSPRPSMEITDRQRIKTPDPDPFIGSFIGLSPACGLPTHADKNGRGHDIHPTNNAEGRADILVNTIPEENKTCSHDGDVSPSAIPDIEPVDSSLRFRLPFLAVLALFVCAVCYCLHDWLLAPYLVVCGVLFWCTRHDIYAACCQDLASVLSSVPS